MWCCRPQILYQATAKGEQRRGLGSLMTHCTLRAAANAGYKVCWEGQTAVGRGRGSQQAAGAWATDDTLGVHRQHQMRRLAHSAVPGTGPHVVSRFVPWLAHTACPCAVLQAATVAVSGKAGRAFWCAGAGIQGVR